MSPRRPAPCLSACLPGQVVFYLQKLSTPALLPPLHRLFFSERPAESQPRLLQQGGVGVPEQIYRVVEARVEALRGEFAAVEAPPLAQLLQGFVKWCGDSIGGLLDGRVSR